MSDIGNLIGIDFSKIYIVSGIVIGIVIILAVIKVISDTRKNNTYYKMSKNIERLTNEVIELRKDINNINK